jgi:hypothetical protein
MRVCAYLCRCVGLTLLSKTPKQKPPISIHTSATIPARPGENSCSVSSMRATATPQRSNRLQGLFRRLLISVSTTPSAANSNTCASLRRRPSPAPISVAPGIPASKFASQPLISPETDAGNSELPQMIRRMRMTAARSLLLSLGNGMPPSLSCACGVITYVSYSSASDSSIRNCRGLRAIPHTINPAD